MVKSNMHYHICWSDSLLDWKPFPTEDEAMEMARRIKKPNESYAIAVRDERCERCNAFKSQAQNLSTMQGCD